jgi:hypothetical protein
VSTGAALAEIFVATLALGVVAGTVWLPASVDAEIVGEMLAVRTRGLDVLLCLRSRIDIPLSMVAMIRAVPRSQVARPSMRLPGTHVPRMIIAGSFGTGPDRTFYDIRRAERVLLVSCRLGAEYKLLVLEVPDPDAAAAMLNATLATR